MKSSKHFHEELYNEPQKPLIKNPLPGNIEPISYYKNFSRYFGNPTKLNPPISNARN